MGNVITGGTISVSGPFGQPIYRNKFGNIG